jgi:hypothetical protein
VTDAIGLRKNKKLRNSLLGLAISFRNDRTDSPTLHNLQTATVSTT